MIIIATRLNELELRELIPANIYADANAKAIAQALDPELHAITEDISEATIIPRIDDLKQEVIDLLAWQFHADFYDLTVPLSYATERLKKEAVKNSLLWHKKKGTAWAVKEALRQLDIEAQFVPWWQFGGKPYTFMLDAIVTGDFYKTSGKDILMKSIVRVVNESKAARSYMVRANVEINETESMNITAGLGTLLEGGMTIRPAYPNLWEEQNITAGLGAFIDGEMTIRPAHSDLQEEHCISAGLGAFIEGQMAVRVQYDDIDIQSAVSAPIAVYLEYHIEIGVDDTDMQKLLEKFEEDIIDKLTEFKDEVKQLIEDSKSQWAEDDE